MLPARKTRINMAWTPLDSFPSLQRQIGAFPCFDVGEFERRVVFLHAEHALAHELGVAVALERAQRLANRKAGGAAREPRIDRDAQAKLPDPGGVQFAKLAA